MIASDKQGVEMREGLMEGGEGGQWGDSGMRVHVLFVSVSVMNG